MLIWFLLRDKKGQRLASARYRQHPSVDINIFTLYEKLPLFPFSSIKTCVSGHRSHDSQSYLQRFKTTNGPLLFSIYDSQR